MTVMMPFPSLLRAPRIFWSHALYTGRISLRFFLVLSPRTIRCNLSLHDRVTSHLTTFSIQVGTSPSFWPLASIGAWRNGSLTASSCSKEIYVVPRDFKALIHVFYTINLPKIQDRPHLRIPEFTLSK